MAKMIRGMPVPDAIELLRKTHKKSARLIEGVIRSAAANAGHNFKQDAQAMIVKTIVVNQGTAYRRGVSMARGRVRPIRKFMCHISITLGFSGDPTIKQKGRNDQKKQKSSKKTSQVAEKPVQASGKVPAAKKKVSSGSSVSSASSSSSK